MTTVRELIIRNLKTTLEGISIANGYNNDFQSVQRYDQDNFSLVDVPLIIIAVLGEEKEPRPHPTYQCRMSIGVDVYFMKSSGDSQTSDEYISSYLGDVEKALMVDVQRGGNAMNTVLNGNESFEIGGDVNFSGVTIDIEILYRHKFNDPEVRL